MCVQLASWLAVTIPLQSGGYRSRSRSALHVSFQESIKGEGHPLSFEESIAGVHSLSFQESLEGSQHDIVSPSATLRSTMSESQGLMERVCVPMWQSQVARTPTLWEKHLAI